LEPPITCLGSFGENITVAVFGASGGIGASFVKLFSEIEAVSNIIALSKRKPPILPKKTSWLHIDFDKEETIINAANSFKDSYNHLNIVIVATGTLHDGDNYQPEKTWRSLDSEVLSRIYKINTIGPAILAKYFLPLLEKKRKTVFAFLSARVGSIKDNQTGGWHAYRSSKAALNMLIKNFSIELALKNPKTLCVGLHPGTVNTALSKPFQKNVKPKNLFTADFSATSLLSVINTLGSKNSGDVFAWNGEKILP